MVYGMLCTILKIVNKLTMNSPKYKVFLKIAIRNVHEKNYKYRQEQMEF